MSDLERTPRLLSLRALRKTAERPLGDTHGVPQGQIEEAPSPRFVRRREGLNRRLLALADIMAASVALVAVVRLSCDAPLRVGGMVAATLALLFVNKISGLYDRDELVLTHSTLDELPKLLQISGLFALTTWLLHRLVTPEVLGQIDILELWGITLAGLLAFRTASRALAGSLTPYERCLIIGGDDIAARVSLKMRDSGARAVVAASLRFEHASIDFTDRHQRRFRELLQDYRIERVIVAQSGEEPGQVLNIVRTAKATGLRVSLLPRLLEAVGSSVEFDQLDGLTVLGVRKFGLSRSSRVIKRGMDLLGATLGLLAVFPLFAAIAVAVRLGSPGPVFFRQTRVGRDGERFQMIKFRSMVVDAEEQKDALRDLNETAGLFKIANDPRITRVGSLLRRTSLDELPQLLNVIKGEMSLVGPRPLVEDEDAMVVGLDRSRLHLTPGMTGHWQILGSARVPMDEMVAIDYLYVANWTLWGDVKILLRTVRHVLARRGM